MAELKVLCYIVSATIGGALMWAAALYIALKMEFIFDKSNHESQRDTII